MKETLINNFLRISKIPRKSGEEKQISDFFVNIAKENNLYYYQDINNNLLIRKNGNNKESIAFQAHLDMVCVKRNNHDFKNGINVIIDGDKVTAKDTSLGADQGVGLAIMLTLIEDKTINHPDLEFLFTTEEETTFNGVVTFPYDKVKSKRIINLDNDNDNTITVSGTGDVLNEYTFKSKLTKCDLPCYKIKMSNFPAGNSGNNIELSENNAIATMIKYLKDKEIYLKSINGGTFENDLATSCEVIIQTILNVNEIFKDAEIEKINNNESFSLEDSKKLIDGISDLKSGYLDNASANLGIIKTNNNEIKIYYLIRSIDEKLLRKYKNKKTIFKTKEIYSDPIWNKNKNSKLLKQYKEAYFNKYNEYPKETICQGGSECASILKRLKNIDIISIGATMENCHTTNEITYISSWVKIYDILTKLLED